MLVYVNKKNIKPYYTILLAVKYAGWKTKVVYFNPFNNSIKLEKMWQSSNNYSKRAFYILKESKDWVENNKWIGFDWIIKEINNFRLFGKNKFSIQSIINASNEYKNLIINEWNEIITLEDIESLKNIAFDFHDSYVSKIEEYDNYKIIDFNTTWGCHILLKTYNIREINLSPKQPKYCNIFMDSNIEILNNNIVFKFNSLFCNENKNNDVSKIICETAYWKFVVSKCKKYKDEDD